MPASIDARCEPLRRATHKTIAGVTDDIEKFHFNKAVARLYEFVNAITEFVGTNGAQHAISGQRVGVARGVRSTDPTHRTDDAASGRGACGGASVTASCSWKRPGRKPIARLTVDDSVTIAVQVNGKLRATIELPRDAAQAVAESAALSEDAVQRALAGKPPRKVIIVPNRIVNVVV